MDTYAIYIKNPTTGEWEGIPALRGEKGDNGTSDYTSLQSKPSINGVELNGNKTTEQLGIDIPDSLAELADDAAHRTVTDTEKAAWNAKQASISDLVEIRSGAALGATALQSVPSTYRTSAAQDVIDGGKLNISQGAVHAGEFLVVGNDGNITTQSIEFLEGGDY